MLVRHHEKGWKIISHYTHALLAGKIGCHLKDKMPEFHRLETLTAIINHDDYLVDFDETNYLTDAGTPRDFMMEGGGAKDDVVHAKTLYNETLQKSQWISMLVSRHIEFLYQDRSDKEMQLFLKKMYRKRKEQRRLYGLNQEIENQLYSVLRFCDRLSLIICGDEVPMTGRKLEINKSIDDETYFVSLVDEGKYCIEPWLFLENTFEVDYEYKILEQAKFSSNKELEQGLAKAPVRLQKIILSK
ncbi:uncharacterized protein DUF3891 [Flavobacteriaceae bacterium MAR_2009_75]|nr:uncharacterized protein DUF3891 [Flavobacteriaceae bacterium MAR_2009_75]